MIQIREAIFPNDIDVIASIHAKSTKSAFKHIVNIDQITNEHGSIFAERQKYWKKHAADSLKNNLRVWIAEYISPNGEIKPIGFISLCNWDPSIKQYLNDKGKGAFLGSLENSTDVLEGDSLHVIPKYKYLSIGPALIKEAFSNISKDKMNQPIIFLVYEENKQALTFYHKLGAEPIGSYSYKAADGKTHACFICAFQSANQLLNEAKIAEAFSVSPTRSKL